MTDPRELDPILHADERDDLGRLIGRLESDRPLPSPTFRGQLRRRLLGSADKPRRQAVGSTAAGFRLWAAGYTAVGTLCLAVAAIGLIGIGPFAS
jgi:hypothetical protein